MKKQKNNKPKVEEKLKLDIACGQNKQEGFTGVDYVAAPGVDIVHDLNRFPWPFADNSVDEIFISHYIEHIPHDARVDDILVLLNESMKQKEYGGFKKAIRSGLDRIASTPTEGMIRFMNEIHRILKPATLSNPEDPNSAPVSGFAKIIAPYWSSTRCDQDPTHTRGINEMLFYYFQKNFRDINKLDHYKTDTDFNATWYYSLHPDIANRNEEFKRNAITHQINAINDIVVTMWKRPKTEIKK